MNLNIYQTKPDVILSQERMAILTSNRFRKWRLHIHKQLKEIQLNKK